MDIQFEASTHVLGVVKTTANNQLLYTCIFVHSARMCVSKLQCDVKSVCSLGCKTTGVQRSLHNVRNMQYL